MPRHAPALALLLALSTLAAGCVALPDAQTPAGVLDALPEQTAGVLHGTGGLPVALPGVSLPLAVGAQFHIGVPAPEPTIGVTSDGAVFMTGMSKGGATGRSGPSIYRSLDGGQSWEDVGPKLPTGETLPPITNDPYVHVDTATDRVFMLDLIGTVCSTLSWSDDGGASWTTNPLACGTPLANDHQTMATAIPRGALPMSGYDNVVYYCVNRVADTSCATSRNGGLAFGPLVTVYTGASPEGLCGGLSGHLAADHEGRVFLPRGYCGDVAMVAVTEDDGLTWTRHVIDDQHPVDGHEVRLAVDEANNVYAFWLSEGLPYLAHSVDHGKTWSEAKLVAAPGVTATAFNAIAAGKPGHVAFAYIGTTIEGGYEGKPTGTGGLLGSILGEPDPEEWAEATWNAYIGVTTDALTAEPVFQTVTANDPADPLARGLCGRTRCHGMTDFIDIDIAPDGRPWASFVDVCNEECVTDPEVRWDRAVGFAATLLRGPALRGEATELPALLPPAASSGAAPTEG